MLLNCLLSKDQPPTPLVRVLARCATWPIRIRPAYLEIADFLVIPAPNLTKMEWMVAVHNVHKDTNFLEDPIRYANFTPKKPRRKAPFCHNRPPDCVSKQYRYARRSTMRRNWSSHHVADFGKMTNFQDTPLIYDVKQAICRWFS